MADRKEFEIGGKPLSTLRVVDLKQELEKRGLSKSGSKKELADRLKVQLRLEKLQEHASTDEGHVPNLRLQNEEIAENDLIKDYLSKQQQTYEMQKEARRIVELEEQRVRDSSEASAGDTSQGEEEVETQNLVVNQSEQTATVPENQNQNDTVTEVSTGVLEDVNRTNLSSENSSDNQISSDALDLSTTGEKHFQDVAESKSVCVEETSKVEQSEPEIIKSEEKPIKITIKKEKPIKLTEPKPITETISEASEVKKNLVPEMKKDKQSSEKSKKETVEQASNPESGHGSSPVRDMDTEASNPEALVKETAEGSRGERETSSSPSRESVASESRQGTRSLRRSSSASSRSSTSSRSRSSDSQSSDSRSRSRKRKEPKRNEKFRPSVAVDDSTSQSSIRQEIEMKVSADEGDKMMDVEESSNTVDEVSTSENKASRKSDETPSTTTGSTVKISSRSISLSSIKENQASEEGKENLDTNEVQVPRKRKWGNSGAAAAVIGRKTSLSISTDSLKGLIPEIKPLASANSSSFETTVASTEIVDSRPAPPLKTVTTPTTKREMIVFNTAVKVEKEDTEALEPPPKITRNLSRRISASGLEAVAIKGAPGPARHPPSRIVHIRNLVRPFTLNQLKEHLSKTGTLVDGGFWIDKIKSKCYVTYENEEEAVNTRQSLHGTQWPSSNPKFLTVDFATQDEVDFHRNLSEAPDVKPTPMMLGDNKLINERPIRPKALSPRRGAKASVDEEKLTEKVRHDSHRISDRDNKDAIGLGGDKEKRGSGDRGRNQLNELNNNERDRPFAGNRREREMDQRARMKEKNKQPPIREWDREKIGERSPGERDRARVARNRNRSRSTSRTRAGAKSPIGRRDRNRDLENRERNDRRKEEEAPAKLLDDLFRKTKTTPCIYWLPLTADQINMKEEQRKLRQVEREKRRQLNDHPAENVKSLGPRSRSREKEENRSWRKSRSPMKAARNRRR